MVVVGVGEVVGGLVYGKMIDCFGVRCAMCSVLVQNCGALALSWVGNTMVEANANDPDDHLASSGSLTVCTLIVGAGAFLLGMADNVSSQSNPPLLVLDGSTF